MSTDVKGQTVEECVELAKRAFARKKYEQAVEHYAAALELTYVVSNVILLLIH